MEPNEVVTPMSRLKPVMAEFRKTMTEAGYSHLQLNKRDYSCTFANRNMYIRKKVEADFLELFHIVHPLNSVKGNKKTNYYYMSVGVNFTYDNLKKNEQRVEVTFDERRRILVDADTHRYDNELISRQVTKQMTVEEFKEFSPLFLQTVKEFKSEQKNAEELLKWFGQTHSIERIVPEPHKDNQLRSAPAKTSKPMK